MNPLGSVKGGGQLFSNTRCPQGGARLPTPGDTTPIASTPTSSASLSSSASLPPPGLDRPKKGAQENSFAPHQSVGSGLNVRLGSLGNFCLLLLFFKLIRGQLGNLTSYAPVAREWFK